MSFQTEDIRKEHLQDLLNEVSNSIELMKRKYFHVQTIENLIFHFDKIKIENDKKWVYENLLSYFEVSFEIGEQIDRHRSEEIYFDYINKLTDYYSRNLDFKVILNRNLVYFIYLFVLILSYFLFNIYIVIALIFIFSISTFRMYKKYKEKKVYSLFW